MLTVVGKSFFVKLLTLSFVLLTVGLIVFNTYLAQYNFPAFPFLVIYFFTLTFATHGVLVKIMNVRFGRFSSLYMLITGVKMLINIVFLVFYIWLNRKGAFPFLISFLLLYFSFTIFEVVSLLSLFKEKKSPPTIIVH